jgi:hypothetical protein
MKTRLPPDPEAMNENHAERARQCIADFITPTVSDLADSLVVDILCDFMHLSDRDEHLADFDRQLTLARFHYQEETKSKQMCLPAKDSPRIVKRRRQVSKGGAA